MQLETDRLILRSLMVSDIPALVRIWTDPDVTRFMGGPRDAATLEPLFLEDVHNPNPPLYDLWPVIEKSTGQVIGYCGVADKEVDGVVEYELTYVFAKEAWGRGYATEISNALRDYAFNAMGLNRIIALIEPENEASERVAKKVGMYLEKETVRPSGHTMRVYVIEKNRSASEG